jgi:serine/threonine protein phosphatase PrpC
MVIASDGVWEFLSNEQVANIVQPFYNQGHAEQAANCIVRESANQWKQREDVIDDITCVVVFLDTQLVDRSLKLRAQHIDTLIKRDITTDQEHNVTNLPMNSFFKDFNLASSYEGGVKK